MGSKWADAKPAEKLLTLYTLLLGNPRPVSLSQLARQLDCSKQTICRLIDQIEYSQFGKVLRENRGRQCWYTLSRPKQPPAMCLNAEGLTRLALCREFMQKLLPPRMQRLMEKSLVQAAAYQDSSENAPLGGLGAQLDKGHIDYAPFEPIMNRLLTAIVSGRVCEIAYRSQRSCEPRKWSFAPKRLLAYHECIYVAGWRVTDSGPVAAVYEDPLQLPVQRFVSCELTRRSAAELPEPEAGDPQLGIMQGEEFEVRAAFSARAATYAAERQWSDNQSVEEREDGSIVLTLRARNEAEAIAWALGFGPECEILQPDWLRESMLEKIAAMTALYGRGHEAAE